MNVYLRGGIIYEMPIGSSRFGVKIKKPKPIRDEIFSHWHNSYHGTKAENVGSIVENGLKIPDGVNILIRPRHIPNKNHIYSSPSFAYCCFASYATSCQINGKKYRFFLQLRQKPDSYQTQKETLNKNNKIYDKYIDEKRMEYFTIDPQSIAIIGIIVYEISSESNASLPKELVNNVLNELYAEYERDENSMKKTFTNLKKKYPDMVPLINSSLDFINLFSKYIQNFENDIEKNKNLTAISKIGFSTVSIVGGVLCFTPLGTIGIAMGVLGTVLNLGSGGISYWDKTVIKEKLESKLQDIERLNKIIEEFYVQKNVEFTKKYIEDKTAVSRTIVKVLGKSGNFCYRAFYSAQKAITNLKISNITQSINGFKNAEIGGYLISFGGDFVGKLFNSGTIKKAGEGIGNAIIRGSGKAIQKLNRESVSAAQGLINLKHLGKFVGLIGIGLDLYDIKKTRDERNEKNELQMKVEEVSQMKDQLEEFKIQIQDFKKYLEKYI